MKNKKMQKTAQKICREDASLWTKLHNEPYLREHPKTFAVSLFSGMVLGYFFYVILFVVFFYIWTSVIGAVEVL